MIRAAKVSERVQLTRLCIQSKSFWDYPAHYLEKWAKELTISTTYIKKNQVYVLEQDKILKGIYTLIKVEHDLHLGQIHVEAGVWLDHFFIHPHYIATGMGRVLWQDLLKKCREQDIKQFMMFVDPHARGFYIKMGCQFVRMSASSIPGREIPVFKYQL